MLKKSLVRMMTLGIIAICFLCVCASRVFSQDAPVTIIMEKTAYEAGEKIAVNADFSGVIYVWSYGCWSVQRFTDGVWTAIAQSGCISSPSCDIVNSEKLEQCKTVSCERDCWYETRISDSFHDYYAQWVWDSKYEVARKAYACEMSGSARSEECVVYSPAAPGRYKIGFEYASRIDTNDIFKKEGIDINRVEKEFIIK